MTAKSTHVKGGKPDAGPVTFPDGYAPSAPHAKSKNEEIAQKTSTIHTDLPSQLLDETDKSVEKIFQEYHEDKEKPLTSLTKRGQTVYHTILEELDERTFSDKSLVHNPPVRVRQFWEHLVIHYSELLQHVDYKDIRPLEKAADRCKPLVFVVADLVVPDATLEQLKATCPLLSPLPTAATCPVRLPARLENEISFLNQISGSEKRCIHDSINVKKLEEWTSKLKTTLRGIFGPLQDTKTMFKSLLHTLLEDNIPFTKIPSTPISNFERLIELCPDTLLSEPDFEGYTPLHRAIRLYRGSEMNFSLLYYVIESLVRRSPNTIYIKTSNQKWTEGNDKSPYSLLEEIKKWVEDTPGGFTGQRKKWWKEAHKLLRHTCIGDSSNRDEKLDYLYGGEKDALSIHFELKSPKPIDRAYVEDFAERVNLNFDTALEYVSLRHVQSENQDEWHPDAAHKDRNPYHGVFSWLKVKQVAKIFKVTADDLVPYPHTDSVIRELKGFEIETWDWRKLDLCSETIVIAAPGTLKLYLHWSGNEAVLRSWACDDGLFKLTEMRETKTTCEELFEEFRTKVLQWRPNFGKDNIEIDFPKDLISSENESGDIEASQDTRQYEQAWVKCMSSFTQWLMDKRPKTPVSVSIALIDDGVDVKAHGIPYLWRGKSFYGREAKNEEFHSGPSPHGTKMAICVNKVCPMVHLYVARMDDSVPLREKFTVKSAAESVEWAIKIGVDIISMSWTFNITETSGQDNKRFEDAIREAVRNDILLFASLNDTERANMKNYYPVGLHDVIRIGSATARGDKADFTQKGAAHFLFPGSHVPLLTLDPTTRAVEEANGSSLATAFAAGLAGLIIYSMRVHENMNPEATERQERLRQAKKRSGMEKIFRRLGGGDPDALNSEDLHVGLGEYFHKDPKAREVEVGMEQFLGDFLQSIAPFK